MSAENKENSLILLLNSSKNSLLIARVTRQLIPQFLQVGMEIVACDKSRYSEYVSYLMKLYGASSLPAVLWPARGQSFEGVSQIKDFYSQLLSNPPGPNPLEYTPDVEEDFKNNIINEVRNGQDQDENDDDVNIDAIKEKMRKFNEDRKERGAGIQFEGGPPPQNAEQQPREPMRQQQRAPMRQQMPRNEGLPNGLQAKQLRAPKVSREQALRTGDENSEYIDDNFDIDSWMKEQKIN